MIARSKQWFFALSPREQYILALGSVIVAAVGFYSWVVFPLYAKVASLQQAVKDNQALLVFVEHARPRILRLRQQPVAPVVATNILVEVEHGLAAAKLATYLQGVQQPQANTVSVSLHAVPFDRLIDFLQNFALHYQVVIMQFHASKGALFGTADVQFTLRSMRP